MNNDPHPFDKFFDEPDQLHATPVSREPIEVVAAEPQFAERCPKCNGTGRFRNHGACFTCKGKGKRFFKTSTETRAKAREKIAEKKARSAVAWAEANKAEWEWIITKAPTFGFAAAMMNAVAQYGHLTDGQLDAVHKCMASDAARAERKAAEAAERQAQAAKIAEAAPEVSIAAIETAFDTARENGVRFPKLRLDTFIFSPAGANSRNPGAIYVKEGSEYLGMVKGGKFLRVRACDDVTEARIIEACADPAKAAVAYGQRFGACSICGRELTNKISIEAGIGPICAERYGF